jgi:hypothetical protein
MFIEKDEVPIDHLNESEAMKLAENIDPICLQKTKMNLKKPFGKKLKIPIPEWAYPGKDLTSVNKFRKKL